MFSRRPRLASSMISLMSDVLSSRLARPVIVPPPMPTPPMCVIFPPATCTSEVPVPMLTTIVSLRSV